MVMNMKDYPEIKDFPEIKSLLSEISSLDTEALPIGWDVPVVVGYNQESGVRLVSEPAGFMKQADDGVQTDDGAVGLLFNGAAKGNNSGFVVKAYTDEEFNDKYRLGEHAGDFHDPDKKFAVSQSEYEHWYSLVEGNDDAKQSMESRIGGFNGDIAVFREDIMEQQEELNDIKAALPPEVENLGNDEELPPPPEVTTNFHSPGP